MVAIFKCKLGLSPESDCVSYELVDARQGARLLFLLWPMCTKEAAENLGVGLVSSQTWLSLDLGDILCKIFL